MKIFAPESYQSFCSPDGDAEVFLGVLKPFFSALRKRGLHTP